MKLYEISIDWTGESYVRVYVWAGSDEQAFDLARQSFEKAGYPKEIPLKLKETSVSSDSKPSCTIPSDSGWDEE
jgi:hypothetical protein